jgi:ATP-dependent Zn protease
LEIVQVSNLNKNNKITKINTEQKYKILSNVYYEEKEAQTTAYINNRNRKLLKLQQKNKNKKLKAKTKESTTERHKILILKFSFFLIYSFIIIFYLVEKRIIVMIQPLPATLTWKC